ncbi:MAG TPA: hypothetical protein VF944_09905 [Candidatus Bathyarchaeia archaeon]
MRWLQSRFIQDLAEKTACIMDTENWLYAKVARRILGKMGKDLRLMNLGLSSSAGLLDSFSLHDRLSFLL